MHNYKDKNGNSGVVAYSCGEKDIMIKFKDGAVYLYNYASSGADKIEYMKKLAIKGEGLATYINQNVRETYAKKIL